MQWPQSKFSLRPWATVAYFALFAVNALITLSWLSPQDRMINFDLLIPGIYSHTTNLVISSMLVLSYGLLRLVGGGGMREITVFALLVVASNYFYELLLPLWNVKDAVDAHYGAAGSLISLALLALVKRFGLSPKVATKARGAGASSSEVG